jgi:hypothetical protein
MGQGQGKVPIVGDDQEPFAIPVETSHRKKAGRNAGKKIKEGTPPMGIMGRTKHIAGLVEEKIELTLNACAPAIHLDAIGLRVDGLPLLRDNPAVHLYPTFGNQRLTGTART